MSGGSFNYDFYRILDTYKGQLQNDVLEELLIDFCKVLKELEWYVSADTSKEDYDKEVESFIKKWLISGTAKEKIVKADVLARIERCIKDIKEDNK